MNLISMTLRVVLVLAASLSLTIATLFIVKVIKIDMKDVKQRTGKKFMLIALIANLLFVATVFAMMYFLDHRKFLYLGFAFSETDILFSVLAFLITFASAATFAFFYHRTGLYRIQSAARPIIRKEEMLTFLVSFAVLFIAALQEEIMYRGYLGYIFKDLGFTMALLLSSVIFTVWHFFGNKVTIYQTIDWLVGGLLLFFVYTLSHSIWVAALVHFSRNLTNVFIWNIADKHSFLQFDRPLQPIHKTVFTLVYSILICQLAITFFQLA